MLWSVGIHCEKIQQNPCKIPLKPWKHPVKMHLSPNRNSHNPCPNPAHEFLEIEETQLPYTKHSLSGSSTCWGSGLRHGFRVVFLDVVWCFLVFFCVFWCFFCVFWCFLVFLVFFCVFFVFFGVLGGNFVKHYFHPKHQKTNWRFPLFSTILSISTWMCFCWCLAIPCRLCRPGPPGFRTKIPSVRRRRTKPMVCCDLWGPCFVGFLALFSASAMEVSIASDSISIASNLRTKLDEFDTVFDLIYMASRIAGLYHIFRFFFMIFFSLQ